MKAEIHTSAIGVALYRIKCNGSLHGRWTVANTKEDPHGSSDGEMGIEIATPLKREKKSLAGLYKVDIYLNDKNIFSGKLRIESLQKDSYQLFWMKDSVVLYKGYGVRRKRTLAANYWKIDQKKHTPES
ncbi:MAG: hypothetical protein AAGD28_32885 [Bacteroidota bacterium]